MIETEAVRYARAAIVSHETKVREALRAHQFDLVGRHRTLRIVDAALTAGGLRRIAVPAEVAADHGESLGEARRDPVPHHVRLRVAVQQQDWRSVAADDERYLRAGRP